jgi:hypothetical protein
MMPGWNFDGVNTADLEKTLFTLEGKLLSSQDGFSTRDPRREKAHGLRRRIPIWRRDFDCLYVIWSRWDIVTAPPDESKHTESISVPGDAIERRHRNAQLDVDIPSFYFFAGRYLDHAAECVGFLLGSEVLDTHAALCKREVLPAPLQEIALGLHEELVWYQSQEAAESSRLLLGQASDPEGAGDIPDLTDLLKRLQTYAFGLAEFLDKAIQHPALKTQQVGDPEPTRRRVPLAWAAGAVVAVIALLAVVPSWNCAWPSVTDVWDSSDMEPPLPANCQLTSDKPSDATLNSLESRRQEQGLEFDRVVTCKMSGAGADSRWLEGFYEGKSAQHRRHVFIAEMQKAPGGGVLFVVESCLMPRWKYLKRLGGRCDAEL